MDLKFLLGISCLLVVGLRLGEASFLGARDNSTAELKTTKPIIFVIGADGLIGKMAVSALSSMHGKTLDIRAGVRNPAKAKSLKLLTGVTILQAELGKKERLRKLFEDVNAVYIVCSDNGVQNRAQRTIDTAEAAKDAGVKHILVYSTVTADCPDTLFGKQYNEIEKAVSNLGVPFTILRLPILIINLLIHQPTIKNMSTIFWPVNPDVPFNSIVTKDASTAAAVILASPQKHAGKTYTIVSDRVTYNEIAEAFTKALGRHVGYVRISSNKGYENAKAVFQKIGFSENRAEAILELYRLVAAGRSRRCVTNQENLNDFSEITGEKPTLVRTWINEHTYTCSNNVDMYATGRMRYFLNLNLSKLMGAKRVDRFDY